MMDMGTAKRLAWACQHGDCRAAALDLPCPLYTTWAKADGRIVIPTKRPDCSKVTAEQWLSCAEDVQ